MIQQSMNANILLRRMERPQAKQFLTYTYMYFHAKHWAIDLKII